METVVKRRVDYLDCARALCMLWIVGVFHMYGYMGRQATAFMTEITYGTLSTFVYLGGGFVGRVKFDSPTVNGTVRLVWGYYKKRIVRIYPLMFIASIGFMVTYGGSWKISIANFFGVTMLVGKAPLTLWFVGMQILFYIITPWLQIVSKRVNRLIPCIVVYLCFYVMTQLAGSDTRLLMYFPVWCAGLYIGERHIMERQKLSWINLLIFCFIGLACIYGDAGEVTSGTSVIGFILMGAFIVIFLEFCRAISKCRRLTDVLCKISYASMVAYMFHRPTFCVLQYVIGNFSFWTAYLLILPTFLIVCYGIQAVYDRFVRNVSKANG